MGEKETLLQAFFYLLISLRPRKGGGKGRKGEEKGKRGKGEVGFKFLDILFFTFQEGFGFGFFYLYHTPKIRWSLILCDLIDIFLFPPLPPKYILPLNIYSAIYLSEPFDFYFPYPHPFLFLFDVKS